MVGSFSASYTPLKVIFTTNAFLLCARSCVHACVRVSVSAAENEHAKQRQTVCALLGSFDKLWFYFMQ